MPISGSLKLENLSLIDGVVIADFTVLSYHELTTSDPPLGLPPTPPAPPAAGNPLPDGYATNVSVGLRMLKNAVDYSGLNPVAVQGHGAVIVDALKRYYPDLKVYVSKSDAVVWPGFGSLDVTIDSGKGGWCFRVDGVTPYNMADAG